MVNIMSNWVSTLIEVVVIIVGLICFNYIPQLKNGSFKNIINTSSALDFVSKAAFDFVVFAKNKLSDKTGNEKFDYVVEQIKKVCEQNNITITEEQIKAIIEKSYQAMVDTSNKRA